MVALFVPVAAARATWPSYLAFALLAIALVAVVWHNQRARRRAARKPDADRDEPS